MSGGYKLLILMATANGSFNALTINGDDNYNKLYDFMSGQSYKLIISAVNGYG